MSVKELTKEEAQAEIDGFREFNQHGGNWETHKAEVVLCETFRRRFNEEPK